MCVTAQRIVALVHVPPKNSAYLRMSIDDVEKLLGVDQTDGIEPTAAGLDRMMVQHDEHVKIAGAFESDLEAREFARPQQPLGAARHMRVEHHEAPAPKIVVAAVTERFARERLAKQVGIVVVARDAKHRFAERREFAPRPVVALGIVVDDVAGE